MLPHIWMKVCSKLPYEELQIKFDFRHGWPTFSWVIALCSNFVFHTFPGYAFTYLNESWLQASIWSVTDQVWLSSRLTYFFMSYCPLFKFRFPDFSRLCFHISEWKLVANFHMNSYRSSLTFVTVDLLFHELLPFFKNRFPDFSRLCFRIYEWKLVGSFHMKSYRSSSTFVTVDPLFHELLPFVQISFSILFLAMLSHIWMKVGCKLPYKVLQIKFDFRHGWPTFSWVIALCSNFVFRTFLGYAFIYLNESW